MANPEHLAKLKEGVEAWNLWRKENPDVIKVDLRRAGLLQANLIKADLRGAILEGADLRGAYLNEAHLEDADLRGAILFNANLREVHLNRANLRGVSLDGLKLIGADLGEADLTGASLRGADLTGAHLNKADLRWVSLTGTCLNRANLTGCNVYGVSVWDAELEGAIQSNLIIPPRGESSMSIQVGNETLVLRPPVINGESTIEVDSLEVAQFIYLLLNNERIRNVIDTITSKVVLILGRFTEERKAVLDAIREELRKRDYLPILFDFQKPKGKDLTGTVTTLANMARFIIADLTDPSSVPHELAMVIPGTVVPVQTIVLEGQREYAMFRDLQLRYHWVLEPYRYESEDRLLAELDDKVIAPAEAKAKQLRLK
jgi:uncharacterized protein YjbI with pentapeptide repeats